MIRATDTAIASFWRKVQPLGGRVRSLPPGCPCSASAMSWRSSSTGSTVASDEWLARTLRLPPGFALGPSLNDRLEEELAVVAAQQRLRCALRVGHQAQDVAVAVAYSRDGVGRAVGVGGGVDQTFGGAVAQDYLLVALDFGQRFGVGVVAAFAVGDGQPPDCARRHSVEQRTAHVLFGDMHPAA